MDRVCNRALFLTFSIIILCKIADTSQNLLPCPTVPYPRILSDSSQNSIITNQFDHDMHGGNAFDKLRLVSVGAIIMPSFGKPILSYFEEDPLIYQFTIVLEDRDGMALKQVSLASKSKYCVVYAVDHNTNFYDRIFVFDLLSRKATLVRRFPINSQMRLVKYNQRFL